MSLPATTRPISSIRARRCTSTVVFAVITVLSPLAPQAAEQEPQTAAELLEHIRQQPEPDFKTVSGANVVRTVRSVSAIELEQQLEQFKNALEKAKKARIENDHKFGIKTDVAKLDAENAETVEEFKQKRDTNGIQTYAIRYVIKGDSYRCEQMSLSDDVPLKQLKQQLESDEISFEPNLIYSWNGKKYAEIFYPTPSPVTPNADGSQDAPSKTERVGYISESDNNSRDEALDFVIPSLFRREHAIALSLLGSEFTLSKDEENNGERTWLIQAEVPKGGDVNIEMTVLPEKRYAVQSSVAKTNGVLKQNESLDQFVKVSENAWLPTAFTREDYDVANDETSILVYKREWIAFEQPKINTFLPESLFNLADSEEFKNSAENYGH